MNKIIIVDDEVLIRYSLASLFRDLRTELFTAETGIAALHAVRSHRLDLCLLDIHLPDMNGLDIMKALRAISPWTRIIIVTGSLITDEMMRSVQENAHGLIAKPFDMDEVSAIARWLLAPGGVPYNAVVPTDNNDSCVLWIADEVRKHPRRSEERDIVCHAISPADTQKHIPVHARVLDISESGMCILTPVDVQPGDLVRSSDGSMNGGGVVRWCQRSDPAGDYRVGIQFIAKQYSDYLMGISETCWSGVDRRITPARIFSPDSETHHN
jgi:CheY-like chemotaxis protein